MKEKVPNTALRKAREKRRWTLEYVAEQLDTDPGTVGRWERGEMVPKPAMQSKLADLYKMSPSELDFQEEPVDVSHQYWYVPYRRNAYYTDGEQMLQMLHDTLYAKNAVMLTQALSGLGGIGKTQLALEYAYRYRDKYTAVIWIGADSPAVMFSHLDDIVKQLNLSILAPRDQQQVLFAFHSWLSSQKNWLLVLDNVEDFSILDTIFPDENVRLKGHIVLTTRSQAVGPWANKIAVETMGEEEGATFLLRRAKVIQRSDPLNAASEQDQEKAKDISAEMDGLPLALDQAGAYIEETGCNLVEYLDLYQERHAYFLRKRGTIISGHSESVATTFELSFDKVQQSDPMAAELLRFCAFLHPDAIPEELILRGASHVDGLMQVVPTDSFQLQEALAVLSRYSLLRRDASAKTLSMHRLVQAVLRNMMDDAAQRQRAERVVQALVTVFALEGSDTWQNANRYLPHAFACAEFIEKFGLESETTATLLSRIGTYLRQHAQYKQAEQFYEHALARFEQLLGSEDPEVATVYNNLALVYVEQGKYGDAQRLFGQAESMLAKIYPLEHPKRVLLLCNLAQCHWQQGHLQEARRLGELAITLVKKVPGFDALDFSALLVTLATVYRDLGNVQQAEQFYQHALTIREQTLPPGHPLIAFALSPIATNCFAQGQYDKAADYQEHALAIFEQALGPDHPEVALCLFCLADTYMMLGDFTRAEQANLRSLSIFEKMAGPEHPNMAQPLAGLAMLAQLRGQYLKAEQLYLRAITLLEQTQGPMCLDLIGILNWYAELLSQKGKREKARMLRARAAAIEKMQKEAR